MGSAGAPGARPARARRGRRGRGDPRPRPDHRRHACGSAAPCLPPSTPERALLADAGRQPAHEEALAREVEQHDRAGSRRARRPARAAGWSRSGPGTARGPPSACARSRSAGTRARSAARSRPRSPARSTSVKLAAPESGMTTRRSTVNGPAPSTEAASISSCGTVRKKFVEEEDRERHEQARVEDDHRLQVVDPAGVDHEHEHRHEQRDRRHDHQRDAGREEDAMPAEAPEDDRRRRRAARSASRRPPTRA